MKKILAVLTLFAVVAVPVHAQPPTNHVVGVETAQARLLDAVSQRDRDLARLDALFASSQGAAAASSVGLDANFVRGAVSTLSDEELRDLAARAADLESDPVAGAFTTRQIVWIAVIALAVVLLVALID
jgi:hypothetical protein